MKESEESNTSNGRMEETAKVLNGESKTNDTHEQERDSADSMPQSDDPVQDYIKDELKETLGRLKQGDDDIVDGEVEIGELIAQQQVAIENPPPELCAHESIANDSWGNAVDDGCACLPIHMNSCSSGISKLSDDPSELTSDTTGLLNDQPAAPLQSSLKGKRRFKQTNRSRSVRSTISGDAPIMLQGLNDVEQAPPFLVSRSGSRLSEWDLTNSLTSAGEEGSGSEPGDLQVRRRPKLLLQRENLIESLAWFSFHTPRCVLEDLTAHELVQCENIFKVHVQGSFTPRQRKQVKERAVDADDGSVSSLSDDETRSEARSRSPSSRRSRRNPRSERKRAADVLLSQQLPHNTLRMPYSTKQKCALVFVDISGFTKLSTILDEESLSKVINTYFRMLVDEVVRYGGDILKFAGDAFFAEWRVKTEDEVDAEILRRMQNHPLTTLRASLLSTNGDPNSIIKKKSLAECVLAASQCAASIVELYSDFQLQTSREFSISFGKDHQGKGDAVLDVHCGVGCGSLIGLHVGDTVSADTHLLETRREFLFLGDPIDQVSQAENEASKGEVFASPQVIQVLRETCTLPEELLQSDRPVCIAARQKTFFSAFEDKNLALSAVVAKETTSTYCESLMNRCAAMDEVILARLHRQLSLYVHPVVREDELDATTSQHGIGSMRSRDSSANRHLAEAELRLVYTLFVKVVMDPVVTDDPDKDAALYQKLQRIMQVTCRELHRCSGQLRQFIVDDKGVVLIGTFGLRGSTFANMVTNHALPATFAIHKALKTELHLENKIGATFGKVYCGVVGGVHRHEFAVMGAPVNLAARLMYSKNNHGILVDEAVQAHADSRFAFNRLPHVEAKGYDKPVIIFEPLHAVNTTKKRGLSHGFIGRHRDVAELTDVSKSIINDPEDSPTIMAFIIGEPGIGKTALGFCVYEEMKLYASLHHRKIIFYRSTSTETEQRIPLSSFRKIFLGAIREFCHQDGWTVHSFDDGRHNQRISQQRRGSLRPHTSSMPAARRRSLGGRVSSMRRGSNVVRKVQRVDSSHSVASMRSTRSLNVPYLKKLLELCEELDYPHEFADIVGSQLLGLDGANPTTHVEGRVPSVDEVVDFLSRVYIRLTEFSDLTMIFLDDFQWIDSFTWKVIKALCEKGKNIIIMGAMRSQETQSMRRMSAVATWHTRMQSRKGIVEVNIGPLETDEVRQMIAKVLDVQIHIIDEELSNSIFQRTGGITIYVIELLETIKRNKTVAVDPESGMLKWTAEAERELKRIGSNSVAAIELSFLNRFDSLPLDVRRVLQTCAVLGMSFSLSDVIRVHPEMEELGLELSLNAAVDELILVEDVEDEDEDDLSLWSGKVSHLDRNQVASWNGIDDRFFQFSHAMWRKSVLDAMLSEQKVHLHRTIAEAMEKEQILVMESSDIGRLLTLFDHWKSCGNFGKAAPLALAVGLRLEEWDLSAQSLDLYRDALEMCYESADNLEEGEPARDENEVWLPASAPPATVEFILRLHIRIAKCHAHLGEHEQCATTFEDAYKIMTTSPKAAKLNQELVLPIISGLCSIAIQRNVVNTDLLAENEELVERFVREAREQEDEIHISRALSMKASFYARLGRFDFALQTQRELEQVYEVEVHSSGIREEYGKDYAAQSYADSVQWYMLIGNQLAAEQQIDVVIQRHLPQFDLRDVDTVMEIIFPILMVLKSIGRPRDAETILFNNAINPYHDLGGSSSCWLKLFNPIAYLFVVLKMIQDDDFDSKLLTEIEDWVMDPECSIFSNDLQYKGYALIGEICSHLARFKIATGDDPQDLLNRGRMVLTRVVYAVDDDQSEKFLVQKAREALCLIAEMDDENEELERSEPFHAKPALIESIENSIRRSQRKLLSSATTTTGGPPSAAVAEIKKDDICSCCCKCCVIL